MENWGAHARDFMPTSTANISRFVVVLVASADANVALWLFAAVCPLRAVASAHGWCCGLRRLPTTRGGKPHPRRAPRPAGDRAFDPAPQSRQRPRQSCFGRELRAQGRPDLRPLQAVHSGAGWTIHAPWGAPATESRGRLLVQGGAAAARTRRHAFMPAARAALTREAGARHSRGAARLHRVEK